MALIDRTYFTCELDIPRTSNVDVQARLNKFIDKYEKEFLKLLLSDALYTEYWANITYQGVELDDEYMDVKWSNLRSKVTKNMIACYVYFYWMRDAAQQNTGIGVVESKAENATVVSGSWKMVRAWNEMVDGILELYDFLDLNKEVYTTWKPYYRHNLYFRYINAMNI